MEVVWWGTSGIITNRLSSLKAGILSAVDPIKIRGLELKLTCG